MSLDSIKNEKTLINLKAFLILATTFFLIFILPLAHANDDNKKQLAMAEAVMKGPLSVITELPDDSSGSMLHGMYTAALGGDFTKVNTLQVAFDLFTLMGALYALSIAMAHIMENIQREQGAEVIWKCIMEIMVVGLILVNLTDILDAIAKAGSAILSELSMGSEEQIGTQAEELLKAISPDGESSGGWLWRADVNLTLTVPYLLSQLIIVAAKFAVIQILVEILIRKTFAPFAVANIYKEGMRSPGFRYMARYFGAFLKLAVCAIVTAIIPALIQIGSMNSTEPAGGLAFMFDIIAVNFSAVGIMFKAGEYTNDIVGA